MILNHTSDPMLQNVMMIIVVGLANKPFVIGYASDDINKGTPLRYNYNGFQSELYDTAFSEVRKNIIV